MKILVISADRSTPDGAACNLGDALLTDVLAARLRSKGHDVVVLDLGSERSTSDGDRTYRVGLRSVAAEIRKADAVVVGGGTMLQDDRPDRLIGGLPRLCATVSTLAKLQRRPIGFFGVGLDTIERAVPRALVRSAVWANPVVLRDQDSVERFVRYFGDSPTLGADAALLSVPDFLPSRAAEASSATFALNRVDCPDLSEAIVADWLNQSGDVRFLSMDQQPENADVLFLPAESRAMLNCVPEALGWRDAAAQIAASKIVVASRMHALYLALLLGVPSIAVGHSDKVVSFAREFEIPVVDSVSGASPEMARVGNRDALREAQLRADKSLDRLLTELSG